MWREQYHCQQSRLVLPLVILARIDELAQLTLCLVMQIVNDWILDNVLSLAPITHQDGDHGLKQEMHPYNHTEVIQKLRSQDETH